MFVFFFNAAAPTQIYTLSLRDALPICRGHPMGRPGRSACRAAYPTQLARRARKLGRSEEHTSELQSRPHLVCRLLLEKKKQQTNTQPNNTSSNSSQYPFSCVTTHPLLH